MDYTTSAVSSEVLWNLLRQHGFSEAELVSQLGIDPVVLLSPDKHILLTQYLRLWELAIEATGNSALGLHLRNHYNPGQSHFVTSVFRTSSTLLEGLQQWIRYYSLVSDADQFELRETGDDVILVYSNHSPIFQNPWIPELYFSLVAMHFQQATDMPGLAEEIWMAHAVPEYAGEYQAVFAANIKFNQSEYHIRWKRDKLNTTLKSHDPYYHTILRKYADDAIRSQSDSRSFSGKVHQRIFTLLPRNKADINNVAAAFHMDRRTLLRKLKAEGTTFKELLENTRKQLAHSYLAQGLSITQIAFLLGFSATSSFQAAFKRWYQQSPGSYRTALEATKCH